MRHDCHGYWSLKTNSVSLKLTKHEPQDGGFSVEHAALSIGKVLEDNLRRSSELPADTLRIPVLRCLPLPGVSA
jgi:hypothetical protein